VSLAPFVVDDG
jgi:hypothetical protein